MMHRVSICETDWTDTLPMAFSVYKSVVNLFRSNSNWRNEAKKIIRALWVQPDVFEFHLSIVVSRLTLHLNTQSDNLNDMIMLKYYEANTLFRFFVCKHLCAVYVKYGSFVYINLDDTLQEEITAGFPTSRFTIILKSMILYSKGMYDKSYDEFVPILYRKNLERVEGLFMMKCTLKLRKWIVAEKMANHLSYISKDENFIKNLTKMKCFALAQQKKWNKASIEGKKVPLHMMNAYEKATLASCFLHNNEDATELIQSLRCTVYYNQLRALSWMVKGQYYKAIDILKDSVIHPISYFYLGKANWELKNYDLAFMYLIKSRDLYDKLADTQLYIGKWYEHRTWYNHAENYYQSAYKLNTADEVIIKSLSDVYFKLTSSNSMQLFDDHLSMLLIYNIYEPDNKWVNYNLGKLFVTKKDWNNACVQFLIHLKKNERHFIAYLYLAECYYKQERFDTGLQYYIKAMTLEPRDTPSRRLQFKEINRMLELD